MHHHASRMFGAGSVTTPLTGTAQEPAFPLASVGRSRANFKLVLASWQRINAGQTDTNDFEVNVSAYGPRQSAITRVQLVDVDISNTQFLIEPAWCRLYFDMGVRFTTACRDFGIKAAWGERGRAEMAVTTCLPLPLDVVRAWELLPDGWTRLYMSHLAPFPVKEVARAWTAMRATLHAHAVFQLVGVFGLAEPLQLSEACVRDTSAAIAFEVFSPALSAALATAPPNWSFALVASDVPSPAALAKILSNCMCALLCDAAAACGWPGTAPSVNIHYSVAADTFEFRSVFGNDPPSTLLLEGALSAYMGFGTHARTEPGGSLAPRKRAAAGDCACFGAIQQGDPATPAVLASWTETALNTHVWTDVTSFGVRTAAATPALFTLVPFPVGVFTLDALCEALSDALSTAGFTWLRASRTPAGIIEFSSSPLTVFDLDMRGCTAASRLGFEQELISGVTHARSTCFPVHVPLLGGPCGAGTCCRTASCATPPARVTLSVCANHAVFRLAPLPPVWLVTVDGLVQATTDGPLLRASTLVPSGLSVGAPLALVVGTGTLQLRARVWAITSPVDLVLVAEDAPALAGFATVGLASAAALFPSTAELSLNLYFQRTPVDVAQPSRTGGCCVDAAALGDTLRWVNGVDADTFGAEPRTYTAHDSGTLCLPGTLEVCQDSYILLCLAFAAGGSIPCVGDVYYPFLPGAYNFRTVFAKVLRNSFLRADFDRVFDHAFPGSGMQLGYIRVLILNPNGTPYQTHGHPVSVTLKFDAWGSELEWGDGHTVVLGGTTAEQVAQAGAPIVPFARGTIYDRSDGHDVYYTEDE
jgi:hypothetical protein